MNSLIEIMAQAMRALTPGPNTLICSAAVSVHYLILDISGPLSQERKETQVQKLFNVKASK